FAASNGRLSFRPEQARIGPTAAPSLPSSHLIRMRGKRRGLVVYQLLLILLAVALLIWLIVTLVNRNGPTPSIAPADSAVIDTAPVPVPVLPDSVPLTADTAV